MHWIRHLRPIDSVVAMVSDSTFKVWILLKYLGCLRLVGFERKGSLSPKNFLLIALGLVDQDSLWLGQVTVVEFLIARVEQGYLLPLE